MSRKAIVSMAFGAEWERVADVSFETFRDYAQKVGAEFVPHCVRKAPDRHIHWEKLEALSDALSKFDKVMWVDADVIIRPSTPSVFPMVPPGSIGGLNENVFCSHDQELFAGCAFYGVTPPKIGDAPYFNAGVVVYDRASIEVVRQPKYTFVSGMPEQTYQNVRRHALGIPFVHLGIRFNGYHHLYDVEQAWQNKHVRRMLHIVHYAGWAKSPGWELRMIEQMEKDL